MCISRREPTPCGGGLSYAPPSCPGHHVHVEGSSLIASNTVSFDAGTTASNTKRCGASSRKSSSTVRNRWAMTHNVDFLYRLCGADCVAEKNKSGALMPEMRFNHMELTFPRGTLTTELREEIDAFYGNVFGWTGVEAEVVGQMCHILVSEEALQFLLLAEIDKA